MLSTNRMNSPSAEDLRLVDRIRWLRALGLGSGFFAAAAVFREQGTHPLLWAALLFDGFAWPHLAWFLARRSASPQRAEFRHLLIDSACGGAWIALMHFNLVPSLVYLTMMSMDKIAAGGWRFLNRTALAMAASCLVTAVFTGFRFEPDSSTFVILCSAPLLVCYPIAVATTTYALGRRVQRQNRTLSELNRIDPLTSLLNRGHWEDAVSAELQRHQRLRRPAALLMLDIDRFKPINDELGHPTGDEVLRSVAAVLRRTVREADSVGRYGGDEFGILAPDADLQQALALAERVRAGIGAAGFGPGGKLRCTVSIGIGLAGPDMHSSRDWITHADTALYRAKTKGRNRVDSAALSLASTG